MAITRGALIRRINRKLKDRGQRLKSPRSRLGRVEAGAYYIIDVDRNVLVLKHVTLETLGRELGVLSEHEQVSAS